MNEQPIAVKGKIWLEVSGMLKIGKGLAMLLHYQEADAQFQQFNQRISKFLSHEWTL